MQIIGFHPAPGFGALTPGSFVLPQNPLGDNTPRPVSYLPQFGEILRSHNLLPWNPLAITADGGFVNRRGVSGCGGCGCLEGGCGGMGDLSTTVQDFITSIQDNITSSGIPTWAWIAGAAALGYFLFGRGDSEAYSRSVSQAGSRYPRRITKAGRAARSAYRELTA